MHTARSLLKHCGSFYKDILLQFITFYYNDTNFEIYELCVSQIALSMVGKLLIIG